MLHGVVCCNKTHTIIETNEIIEISPAKNVLINEFKLIDVDKRFHCCIG